MLICQSNSGSAGYDFESSEDVVIPGLWSG